VKCPLPPSVSRSAGSRAAFAPCEPGWRGRPAQQTHATAARRPCPKVVRPKKRTLELPNPSGTNALVLVLVHQNCQLCFPHQLPSSPGQLSAPVNCNGRCSLDVQTAEPAQLGIHHSQPRCPAGGVGNNSSSAVRLVLSVVGARGAVSLPPAVTDLPRPSRG
jgi:hypothetical protein